MRFTVARLDSCFSFLLRVFHTANFNEIRTEVCIIGDRGQRASPLCLVIVAVEIFMRDLPLEPMYTLYAHSNGHHFHGAVSPPENFHFIPFFLLSSSPRFFSHLFHSISIFLFFFFRDKLRDLRERNINQCESTRSRNSLQSGRRIDRFWRVVYRIRGWNTRRCVYTHTRNLDGIRNRLRGPLKMPRRWRWMALRVANIYPVHTSLVHSWREYKEMASNGLKSDI